jgi:tellurite resistance protein
MSKDALKNQQDRLEHEFFARPSMSQAVAALRKKLVAERSRDDLAAASGLSDPEALDALIAAGLSAGTLAALALVPLVAVAWADGKIEDTERDAIIRAAEQSGITSEHRSLLEEWLSVTPDARLLEAWSQYIRVLRDQISPAASETLRARILGDAKRVAEAAGGFLGLGNKVSASEGNVLAELKACFAA